ncbi:MAG: glycosyltransferase [Candidatus Omnitrophota bacterium]
MNTNPKISVVMTVYNGERFLAEAIESILNQTFSDFEFIIVDNNSTDKTKDIIRSYKDDRISLIENKENLGQTKALNIGIRNSRAELIARMDADDISLLQRLALQYEYLNSNPSVAVVGSWHKEIDARGRHLKYFRMPTDPIEIKCYMVSPGELSYYCVSHPTVLMRKDVLYDVGLYDENYRLQDYELWVRIVRKYKIANMGKFLLKRRMYLNQQTKEFRGVIDSESEKIISSNIKYYFPEVCDSELRVLIRMFQYKPQGSKEDGLRVIDAFGCFFEKYSQSNEKAIITRKLQSKMVLFYIPQLTKTNLSYSLKQLTKNFCNYPLSIFEAKFYRKAVKAMFS